LRGSADVDAEFTEIDDAVTAARQTGQNGFSASSLVRDGRVLKPLLFGVALMFVQQMSGANAVIFFTSQIFAGAGFHSDPNSPTMIVGAVLIVATIVSSVVADVAGRRLLLMVAGVAMAACIATLRWRRGVVVSGVRHERS